MLILKLGLIWVYFSALISVATKPAIVFTKLRNGSYTGSSMVNGPEIIYILVLASRALLGISMGFCVVVLLLL